MKRRARLIVLLALSPFVVLGAAAALWWILVNSLVRELRHVDPA